MKHDPIELMPPRILVVDDERRIHASLRLRLGGNHDLVFSLSAREALGKIAQNRFDLCFADIHMPEMDGLKFIDAARKVDPQLGYIVLSAFDTDDNLRRSIPLQVYDFISKPLPERHEFEDRIHGWVEMTRKRRREHELALHAGVIATERDSALLERDVELVASESARDALMQAASFLTTIHAHYYNACSILATRTKSDPSLAPLLRGMEEGRRATDAAINITETFLGSAYGSRDSSPAFINEGIRDAIGLAVRNCRAEQERKVINFAALDVRLPLRGLSGIAFLLMIVPALEAALAVAAPNTTIGIRGEYYSRLDAVPKDPKFRSHLWLNRRNALSSHPGWLISIGSNAAALTQTQVESWLNGQFQPLRAVTPRGLVEGIQKCHGLLGFSVLPQADQFRLFLALPTQ